MIWEIKNKIERELRSYINNADKSYSLSKISPLLFRNIKDFISRRGKRLRPILFVIGYLGFAKKAAPGLYRSAISLELLHDFMLVHDDIIDKSDTRRGKPSMHVKLNKYLYGNKNVKFNGQDLAIVIGDVMYSMALHAFLSIKEDKFRKEMALRKLLEAALYTGSGEFIELLYGMKDIDKIRKEDIYKIYALKTANYTFASPLAIGAILAGAKNEQVSRLYKCGTYLGRAFQIKDDILGMFESEVKTGKTNSADLQEAKKTILIWHAYHNSIGKERLAIKRALSKTKVGKTDLLNMRKIVSASGALEFAREEINSLIKKAQVLLSSSKMHTKYKNLLHTYSRNILES